MGKMLCEGDRVLWRDGFGAREPRVARVVSIERCKEPRSKSGRRVDEVEWDLQAYIIVTLEDGSWAYGDQLEPYDVAQHFRATVERWPAGGERRILAVLRAWAFEDEGFADRDVWADVMGDPGVPTLHSTRLVLREVRWSDAAEKRLHARVAAAGGDGARLTTTFP